MKPLKSKISVSLDCDVIRSASVLAEADSRTLSAYINLVLKNHIRACMGTLPAGKDSAGKEDSGGSKPSR